MKLDGFKLAYKHKIRDSDHTYIYNINTMSSNIRFIEWGIKLRTMVQITEPFPGLTMCTHTNYERIQHKWYSQYNLTAQIEQGEG